jgi:pyroglutamyl-peptidase
VNEKLLLLAFGPFGSWVENSTEQVSAVAAARLTDRGLALERRVLDTSLLAVRSLLDDVRGTPPLAVLACGLSAKSASVQIERFARNLADFRIPDVEGAQPSGERVIEGAPERLCSEIADQTLLQGMRDAGVSAMLSEDAGTYICNALYFSLLEALAPMGLRALFIHLPPLPGLCSVGGEVEAAVAMPLEKQVTALMCAAETLVAAAP